MGGLAPGVTYCRRVVLMWGGMVRGAVSRARDYMGSVEAPGGPLAVPYQSLADWSEQDEHQSSISRSQFVHCVNNWSSEELASRPRQTKRCRVSGCLALPCVHHAQTRVCDEFDPVRT